ncbi:MAG TPA: hypothetical protein VFB36_02120 [Nevskiaceae bacterium]|nr:hypothetical protein [Nevskiaceae bacterium]
MEEQLVHADPLLEGFAPIVVNFVYASAGGLLMLVGAWLAYRLFLNVVGFNVRDELQRGNIAVGLAVLGIFLGTGIGFGLVVAMALN